jgi:gamma-glutamyltranspeptidase / glutathione hydrolase
MSAGAIAAGHPETARVGADILAAGGSAVDACVAAGIAGWAAEPTVTGPGGGGFMLVHDARRHRTVALDFFTALPGIGLTPRSRPGLIDVDVEFGTTTQLFRVGPASCAVPGVPFGLALAHRRFGRLPWAELVAPAVNLARNGVEVTPAHAALFAILEAILLREPESRDVFGPDGELLGEGATVVNTRLADTLERYAEHGADEFVEGETGRSIARCMNDRGGTLTADDLARYRVIVRRPLQMGYRGSPIAINPPPSSGGVLIAHALAVLGRLELGGAPNDPASVRAVLLALRAAQAARTAAFERALVRGGAAALMLDDDHVDRSLAAASARAPEPTAARGTSHLSVIDGEGNAASMTCSTGCGSGVFAPGTGVHLNNMLGETDLALSSVRLQPGDRQTSMMSPTLAFRGPGEGPPGVRLALGSSGSERIRSAIVQVLSHVLDHARPVDEAVRLPRLHPDGPVVQCEGGFPEATADALAEDGEQVVRWPDRNLYFGGAQGVTFDPGASGFAAGGDPRRGGHGIVVGRPR